MSQESENSSALKWTYFCGSHQGPWKVLGFRSILGNPIPFSSHLEILEAQTVSENKIWQLKGVSSHARYTTRPEKISLDAIQAPLGREEARFAALIPIKKSQKWWQMTQEERRHIFEEQSQHTSRSLKYLPEISRKLYHSRDLGEPFDFLTWFEFAPEHENMFNDLLVELRSSEEWKYVVREIDIRLEKT